MSTPSWVELSERVVAAKSEHLPSQITAMHVRHGWAPDQTCGSCRHLEVNGYSRRVYYKCGLCGVTNGPGTDWRLKWPACGLFEKEGKT